jgi:hypothetical protein
MGNAFCGPPPSQSVHVVSKYDSWLFQKQLHHGRLRTAIYLAGETDGLDNSQIYFSSVHPACLVMALCFHQLSMDNDTFQRQLQLLKILKHTGGITRESALSEDNVHGINALWIAAMHTKSEMFDFWFNDPQFSGNDWNIPSSKDGRTPLIALLTATRIVPYNTNITSDQRAIFARRALKLICKLNGDEINKAVIWQGDSWTPLTAAVFAGHYDVVRKLLSRVPDIDLYPEKNGSQSVEDVAILDRQRISQMMSVAYTDFDAYRLERLVPQIYFHLDLPLDLVKLIALFVC